jgi:hypothetical protein
MGTVNASTRALAVYGVKRSATMCQTNSATHASSTTSVNTVTGLMPRLGAGGFAAGCSGASPAPEASGGLWPVLFSGSFSGRSGGLLPGWSLIGKSFWDQGLLRGRRARRRV